jgi:hypothetical protein
MSARFRRAWIVTVCTGFEPHLPFSRNSARECPLSGCTRLVPAHLTDPPAAFLSRTLGVMSGWHYRPSSTPTWRMAEGLMNGDRFWPNTLLRWKRPEVSQCSEMKP